jgi:dienelactone hydrolase
MGGELAVYLSLAGIIPSLGFIAFGPGGPYMDNLEKWESIIEEASGTGVQGCIIMGERDHTIPQDNIIQFVELLNQNSIRCQLEIVSGVGHDFVLEYEDSMLRALSTFNE